MEKIFTIKVEMAKKEDEKNKKKKETTKRKG